MLCGPSGGPAYASGRESGKEGGYAPRVGAICLAELGFNLALLAVARRTYIQTSTGNITSVSSVGHCNRKPNMTRMKPTY